MRIRFLRRSPLGIALVVIGGYVGFALLIAFSIKVLTKSWGLAVATLALLLVAPIGVLWVVERNESPLAAAHRDAYSAVGDVVTALGGESSDRAQRRDAGCSGDEIRVSRVGLDDPADATAAIDDAEGVLVDGGFEVRRMTLPGGSEPWLHALAPVGEDGDVDGEEVAYSVVVVPRTQGRQPRVLVASRVPECVAPGDAGVAELDPSCLVQVGTECTGPDWVVLR